MAMKKKSFLSENSTENSWRENLLLRSNIPTKQARKVYYIIYQFVDFLSVCWNSVFVLEHVGIARGEFSLAVGMKKCTNGLDGSSNKILDSHFQRINIFSMPLLECWTVGTQNDFSGWMKKFF
jgi:hypothetical protein